MTIYATMNPVGSTSPKDLKDNTQNLDYLSLGPALSYPDRLGVNRLSWAGIEASFAAAQIQRTSDFNAAQDNKQAVFNASQAQRAADYAASEQSRGYENPVPYVAGIALTRVTQLVQYNSELYKAKAGTLPWTTTGVWATDSANLVPVGDAALRQGLATAAGSSMTGHDGPEATVKEALDSRASGNHGSLYNLIAGTFRKDLSLAPVWKGIFDGAHVNSLMSEPTEVGTELQLNHLTGDNKNIGTMVVVPDESFARAGITFGCSVNKDYSLVSGGAEADFIVDLTNPDVPVISKDSRVFGDARFSATVSASGLITIGHPQVQLIKNAKVQFIPPASSYQHVTPHYVKLAAPGQTTLFLLARMSGRVSFNGSTWGAAFSPFNSLITFSAYNATTGELTVTHPNLTDNNIAGLTNYTSSGVVDSYDVALVANSNTNFIVRFRKKVDDSIPASIPSGVGFTFNRGHSAMLPKSVLAGSINVFLGSVQMDMRDVNWPNANIWTFGMMGKNKT